MQASQRAALISEHTAKLQVYFLVIDVYLGGAGIVLQQVKLLSMLLGSHI